MMTANPAYPGPKRLGPELERLRREGIACDTEWLEYCLGCHRCDLACPNEVDVSGLIAQAKAAHRKTTIRRLRDWWFARPGLLGRLMTILPAVGNGMLRLSPVRWAMALGARINAQRVFPRYRRGSIRLDEREAPTNVAARRVVFFPGCFIRYNQPALGCRILQLLRLNGFAPEVADSDCCGVPALANGNADEARRRAQSNVAKLFGAVEAGAILVTSCSSCGHMLKTGFGHLLEDDKPWAAQAERVAQATYDLGELLVAEQDAGRLNMAWATAPVRPRKLAYHAPCHQKSQGIGRPWFHLLQQLPGVSIEDLNAGCCGMSGTFGFKAEKYEASMAVGENLFRAVREAAPEAVVTECATCQMQIEHGTGVRAVHPVDALLEAYTETKR